MMVYAVVKFRDLLSKAPSVVELGSQTLTIGVVGHPEITTVPEFYEYLGFASYDSIDFNGKGTILGDLNTLLHPKTTYDLVTNNGTGEHIFNQAAVFQNCHDLCKAGGVMLHVLPWVNWNNHGFYNFHPVLFHDLAFHNDYEIIEIFAGDRDGNQMMGFSITQQMDPEPIDRNVLVVAALKKRNNSEFVHPIQTVYRDTQAAYAGRDDDSDTGA